jgi:dihydrolipoamide dehydrogenase
MESSDFVVIGSGPGGYQAAIRAAHHGAGVTLIEERHLGGVCLNRGCIPTKGTVTSIEVLRLARNAAEFGIDVPQAGFKLRSIVDRRNGVVAKIQQGLRYLLEKNKIRIIQARGRLLGDRVVEAGEAKIKAGTIVLATGSHPTPLPVAKPDGKVILNSDHTLEVNDLPASMIILGGGYIGCEYAAIFSQLGTKVTVIELMDRLLPLMDSDLGRQLERSFKKQGVMVRTGQKVESTSAEGGRVRVTLAGGETLEADKLLVSVGRLPNTEGLGLENEKIAHGPYVPVNEHMETSAKGIYALGDLVGKFPLAHVASAQARVAVNCVFGIEDSMDYRVVPSAVFTYPELASVGLSAEDAGKDHGARAAKFPFAALGKPVSQGETEGFVKIVGDEKTGELLGAHIAGLHASELIGTFAVAMQNRMKISELARTIFTHPTYSEATAEAAELWLGKAAHLPPR